MIDASESDDTGETERNDDVVKLGSVDDTPPKIEQSKLSKFLQDLKLKRGENKPTEK